MATDAADPVDGGGDDGRGDGAVLEVLVGFVRSVLDREPGAQALEVFCRDAAAVFDADGAGLMLRDADGDLRVAASSSDGMALIEQAQVEFQEGPCIEALVSGRPVMLTSAEMRERYPRFAERLAQHGVGVVHSVPLRIGARVLGSFNWFWPQGVAVDQDTAETATIVADIAAAYLMIRRSMEESADLGEGMEGVLAQTIVVEQARGAVAIALGVDVDEALQRLQGRAAATGTPLPVVAEQVIAGRLAPDALGDASDGRGIIRP